jgi:amino acid adenylation domain-containing protein
MNSQLTIGQRKIAAAQRPASAAYWTGVLEGAAATGFPADVPSAPRTSGTRSAAVLKLDSTLTGRLAAISRGDDTTLHALLTAAAAALLNAYTGESDLLIGQPSTAVGDLAQVLPMRVQLAPEDTFQTLLGALREGVLGALSHQDYPLELTGVEVEVVAALDSLHTAAAVDAIDAGTVFRIVRTEVGLALDVRVAAGRFTPEGARRLGLHYLRLLTAAVNDPGAALSTLDLGSEDDAAVLAAANDTMVPFPDELTLPQLFARIVESAPGAIAVKAGNAVLTFAALDRASTRLAHTLRQRGVGPEVIVGVLAERSIEMLVGLIAVLKAGGAYIPLDAALPAARIAYMLEDSNAALVLTQSSLARLVPGVATVRLAVDSSEANMPRPLRPGGSTDAAYVIYTSGSTGAPKGVVVEHRSVVNRLHWMQRAYPIGAGDTILQKTPISFDVSVWELFWWHIEGASVCLLEPGGERDPESIVAAVEQHQVTTMHFVPTMLAAFLDYVAATGSGHRLSSLRRVFASGEALAPHHVRRFAELLGRADLINLYGPTEATVDVSHYRTEAHNEIVPIGLPIDNTRLYVLDEHRRRRPVGMPGELYIAGDCLARGYLHRPKLTMERFVENPFPGEDRAYRTGDMVRQLPDGSLEYLGRNDSQVKLRGYRIELAEIEQRLLAHPAVNDAVVIVRTGADGQDHLFGYVVPGRPVTEEALRHHLAQALPAYMVPGSILTLDAFPLSPNGKLDRAALPEPAPAGGADYEAPRTERERALASLLAEVLGLDRMGVHDSFFTLGGDSIHFVTVLARARELGLPFSYQQLFANPTVAGLAALLDGDAAAADPHPRHEFSPFELISEEDRCRIPADVEDAYPMSMLQAGTIFQSEMTRGSSQYHDIIGYLIRSSFDAEVFTEATRILVAQNPIFRTSYRLTGFSEYLQLVHQSVSPPPVHIADLRHLDDSAQDAWYADWEVQEKGHAFDWEYPGLIRLHVHILRDDLYRYSISQHNSALDGWSINLVNIKLFEIYHALRTEGRFTGGAVANHLGNFVGLEQQAIRSPQDRQFWLGVLDGRPQTTIPRLRPPEDAEFNVVLQDVPLPRGLSDRIIALAGRLGIPVKNVLLAAHMKVLAVLAGNRDVLTGYEHSGRPEAVGADQAAGLFLNTVPFRVRLTDGSWEELISQVYATEASLLPHRRYPMAKMKQDLQTQTPLFETVFNFTHFYQLKKLRRLPEFSLLDVRAVAITEFAFRSEFSQHFYSDAVQLSLHYHTQVFDSWQIARIGGYFITALELMTADPSAPHDARPLMGDPELAELARFGSRALPVAGNSGADTVTIVDLAGQPVPLGTPGQLLRVAPGGTRTEAGITRWLPDGSLDTLEEGSGTAAAPQAAPPPAGDGELSATALRVAAVWAEVLRTDLGSIRLTDDFFELGGNSLAAMRAVIMLNGLVTIKEMMGNSRLGELAAIAEAMSADVSTGVLVPLTPPIDDPRATLVCFPYGAGHAVHFRPVADAMRRQDPTCAVLAVELPGHDPKSTAEHLLPVAETARLIVDELTQQARGRIVLWGHCVGSALAIEVARLLGQRGMTVAHLFIGAKLLYDASALRESIEYVSLMTYDDIKGWLTETGFTGFDEIGVAYEDLLVRTFRHDSVSSSHYYLAGHESRAGRSVPVPVTVVCASDDPVTAGFADRYRAWELFTEPPRLRVIAGGGHYFARTRPAKVAEMVAEVLHSSDPAGVDSAEK